MVPGFGDIAILCTIVEAGSADLVQTIEKGEAITEQNTKLWAG